MALVITAAPQRHGRPTFDVAVSHQEQSGSRDTPPPLPGGMALHTPWAVLAWVCMGVVAQATMSAGASPVWQLRGNNGATKHSALALFAQKNGSTLLSTVSGTVAKPRFNPLFAQDKPWEPRLDNAYPNVVHDAANKDSPWQLWYGGCGAVKSCRSQFLYYANSTDGLKWNKPDLGRYDLAHKFPGLARLGKHNNIIMYGGGLGVYYDLHEQDPGKRYKISGGSPAGCFSSDGNSDCAVATAASPDGIHNWTDVSALDFAKPWRPDCHTNLFYDGVTEQYLMTTRDYQDPNGRLISISHSGAAPPNYTSWTVNATGEYPPTVAIGGVHHLAVKGAVDDCGRLCLGTPGCAFFWVRFVLPSMRPCLARRHNNTLWRGPSVHAS